MLLADWIEYLQQHISHQFSDNRAVLDELLRVSLCLHQFKEVIQLSGVPLH